jgi:hypothetical protein
MAIFLLVLLPALSFLSGIVGLQSDPQTDKKKKIVVVLVLALSAIGSVVASLYQQQSDDQAKKLLQGTLDAIEGKTDEIRTILIGVITENGFSPTFVQDKARSGFTAPDLKRVQQSLTADGAVLALGAAAQAQNRQQQTIVTYYAKDVDPSNVNGPALISALEHYGFTVKETSAGERNLTLATNSVWVGDKVSNDQWKLVVLILMRAGLQIRAIRQFRREPDGPSRKTNVIEIGADREVQNDPPKTVQEVQDIKSLPPR